MFLVKGTDLVTWVTKGPSVFRSHEPNELTVIHIVYINKLNFEWKMGGKAKSGCHLGYLGMPK